MPRQHQTWQYADHQHGGGRGSDIKHLSSSCLRRAGDGRDHRDAGRCRQRALHQNGFQRAVQTQPRNDSHRHLVHKRLRRRFLSSGNRMDYRLQRYFLTNYQAGDLESLPFFDYSNKNTDVNSSAIQKQESSP